MKVETPFPMAFQMQPTRQGEEQELQMRHAGAGVGEEPALRREAGDRSGTDGIMVGQCCRTVSARMARAGGGTEHVTSTNRT